MVEDESGSLSGYALARAGTKADYIGPVVTRDTAHVENLLDRILGQLSGSSVYIDFSNECGVSSSVLADRGFVKERDLIRMSCGSRQREDVAARDRDRGSRNWLKQQKVKQMESTATVQEGLERNFRADNLNVYVYESRQRWAKPLRL